MNHKEAYSRLVEQCPTLRLATLIGKRWTFPLICRMGYEESYTFEELVRFTRRRINRTALSTILKELIHLNMIKKEDKRYCFTPEGTEIKKLLHNMQQLIASANPGKVGEEGCPLDEFFESNHPYQEEYKREYLAL